MEKYIRKIENIQKLLTNSEQQQAEEKLQELKNEIIYDLALKKCCGNNNKDRLKYAKKLLKNIPDDKPQFIKMYKIDNTYQLCNGFIAIVLKEPIFGLELNTAECEYFDCRKVTNRSGKNYYEYDYEYKETNIDLLELQQLVMKISKYKDTPYPIELLGHNYNTFYHPLNLLIAIKILGTDNVKVYFNVEDSTDRIYLKSDLGEAIVQPIKVPEKAK